VEHDEEEEMKKYVWISASATLTALTFGMFLGPGQRRGHLAQNAMPVPAPQQPHAHKKAATPAPPILAAAKPSPAAQSPSGEEAIGLDDDGGDEEARATAERAQLARLPVLTAIRGKYESAEARYDAMRGALARSGRTDEAWSQQASEVFRSWSTALGEAAGNARLDSVRCFVAGCEMRVDFPDAGSAERAASAFRTMREDGAMHGGRVQTPAVAGRDGGVEVTWMMLRPDVMPRDDSLP
jgi:hypothetical protein